MIRHFLTFCMGIIVSINLFSQGGVSCEDAAEVTGTGTYTSDNTLGEQWFKYTNPTSKTLEVTFSSCDMTTGNTWLILYKNCDQIFGAVGNDDFCDTQSQITYFVEASETVYLVWRDTYYKESFDWNLATKTPAAGDLCENPKPVVIGLNNSNAPGVEQWYTYTNTSVVNKIIKAESDSISSVSILSGCDAGLAFGVSVVEHTVLPGETVLIDWTNAENWTFSERDISTGDSCGFAQQAVIGENTPLNFSTNQWFVFTNTNSSQQVLEASLSSFSNVFYYSGCDEFSLLTGNSAFVTDFVSIVMEPGEIIYLKFSYVENWGLDLRGIEPGDNCENPIQLEEGLTLNTHQGIEVWTSYTNTTSSEIDFEFIADQSTRNLRTTKSCAISTQSLNSLTDHRGTLQPGEMIYITTHNAELFSLKHLDNLLGDSCEGFIDIEMGTNYPNYLDQPQWFYYENNTDSTEYFSVDAVNIVGPENTFTIITSCEDEIPFSVFGGSSGTVAVKSGQFFWVYFYAVKTWEFSRITPEIGDFCNLPITAKQGTNVADHSNGDQWYVYENNTTEEQLIEFSSCGASVDTYLEVYEDCNKLELASGDDDCGFQSIVSLSVGAGESVTILWSSIYVKENNNMYDWILSIDGVTDVKNDHLDKGLSVYPTSTSGEVYFTDEVDEVKVYNNLGLLLTSYTNVDQIDISSLDQNVYFLNVIVNDKVYNQRVIKE